MKYTDLLNEPWISNSDSISAELTAEGLVITNSADSEQGIWITRAIKYPAPYAFIILKGTSLEGNASTFAMVDELSPAADTQPRRASLNSISFFTFEEASEGTPTFLAPPQSKPVITELEVDFDADEARQYDYLMKGMTEDILVVTPTYPAPENCYLSAFAHSRLVAYQQAGLRFDVACAHQYKGDCRYDFEGINVTRMPFTDLRKILRRKHYKKILVHFFDEKYALLFDSCDIGAAELFLWCHNPEVRYWDSPHYTAKYFEPLPHLTEEERLLYTQKDAVVKRYNRMPNVTWIFISEMQKQRSEQLIGIEFERYRIIPNVIDEQVFTFQEKDPELRKRIFFVRRFDNISSYSIDICVRTIVELSRRPFFNDLEFNIYGTGDYYEELTEPIRTFGNVHLHPHFVSHDEMASIHKSHGIALFPSRFDSQGVSAGEAAMSGLAVISSKIDAAEYFLPEDMGLLQNPNNHVEFADEIEKLYNDEQYYLDCSKACHDKCFELCRREKTIEKEIELITRQAPFSVNPPKAIRADQQPLLSIVIPSYNVRDYLTHGVKTLISHPYAHRLEILIVNDGSKDDTVEIANKLIAQYNDPNAPVIKLIDKQNGGHGSTINAGLAVAKGKYFRVMDGDDWFDSADFAKSLEKLEDETSDIVVMNYSEDRAATGERISKHYYDFMVPYIQYNFEDVCYGPYGFNEFEGPLLSTGCYRTEMLREAGLKLSEHCFYVDVEFDIFCILKAKTISYYPLNVYRYFIGRVGQSVSKSSFVRNVEDHAKVIFNALRLLDSHPELPARKRDYIIHSLLVPVIKTHYTIACEWSHNKEHFARFDKELTNWPEIYNDPRLTNRKLQFFRKTSGKLMDKGDRLQAAYQLAKKILRR